MKVSLGQYSDKGRKSENQDFLGAKIPQGSLLNLKGVALAMADGISSSQVSHIASETAVKNFLEDYYCTSETWSVKNSVERVLNAINSWLYTQTRRGPHRYEKEKGYVCTFSCIVIKNRTAHIFHIGDTRVYRLNPNGLEQLTNDHRLWLTQEQSCLSRALGIESQCSFDYQVLDVKTGDIFILATDGIYEFIDAETIITSIHQQFDNLDQVAATIATKALAGQSNDNLSIQILRVDELTEQTACDIKQQVNILPLPPALEARMVFDGYTILRELHSSNRSHVFLAQDNVSTKNVVLKVLSTEMVQDEANLERFLMEEWVALRIQNPHVLKADLPDKKRNYIYTVFEYIDGQTLAQWAIDNPKPELETVRKIVEQIARGLYAFHRMEMLHQDLRPENIMIDKEGTVKIIDFGAVSIAGLEETQSKAPATYLMGTALYSAPEYFLGEAGTAQSDLFSLGVITYYLLSGRYPYGTNMAKTKTLSAQKRLNYLSLLDEDREIPSWIDAAIRKAVHVSPYK
ncbi:MAG: serine/threonine protein kinase, partial [Cellvibrio sp.]|nr:serine/threonine protein kinase [Cellvibrio sp.]